MSAAAAALHTAVRGSVPNSATLAALDFKAAPPPPPSAIHNTHGPTTASSPPPYNPFKPWSPFAASLWEGPSAAATIPGPPFYAPPLPQFGVSGGPRAYKSRVTSLSHTRTHTHTYTHTHAHTRTLTHTHTYTNMQMKTCRHGCTGACR